jgi:DNA-binding response OmpR family regulator
MNEAQIMETVKPRILIVEDEMPIAMMMIFLLTRADCEATVAATGKRAMQMAEEGNFNLITLAVDLPDGNGFNLCSRLKQHPRLCNTPIVFVSGRTCLEDQQHGLDVGAADYITKPFETFEFVPRLLSHIKASNLRDEFADANAESLCNSTQCNQ